MEKSANRDKPARVPGDAEAPAKGTSDPTIEQAVGHSDATEPTQSTPKRDTGA